MQWEASWGVWGNLHGNKLRQIAGKHKVLSLLTGSIEGIGRELKCSARVLFLYTDLT
jgi:hypothetical protein